MDASTPFAGTKSQRALDELCFARKLSLGLVILTICLTGGAAFSAIMDDESIWSAMSGPLSCVVATLVLWTSCEQRIRALRRELES